MHLFFVYDYNDFMGFQSQTGSFSVVPEVRIYISNQPLQFFLDSPNTNVFKLLVKN